MPRNVRNFWVTGTVDGRGSVTFGGPAAKDGGFDLTIRQRAHGTVTPALTIRGVADSDGNLTIVIEGGGEELARTESHRDRGIFETRVFRSTAGRRERVGFDVLA